MTSCRGRIGVLGTARGAAADLARLVTQWGFSAQILAPGASLQRDLRAARLDAVVAVLGLPVDPQSLVLSLNRALEDKALRREVLRLERLVWDSDGFGGLLGTSAHMRRFYRLMAPGGFRKVLYYRLAVIHLEMPPLRDRGGDIMVLAQHLLARVTHRTGTMVRGYSPDVARMLLAYEWPGNV
jgi:DNA-binding NtrC family response regulator